MWIKIKYELTTYIRLKTELSLVPKKFTIIILIPYREHFYIVQYYQQTQISLKLLAYKRNTKSNLYTMNSK